MNQNLKYLIDICINEDINQNMLNTLSIYIENNDIKNKVQKQFIRDIKSIVEMDKRIRVYTDERFRYLKKIYKDILSGKYDDKYPKYTEYPSSDANIVDSVYADRQSSLATDKRYGTSLSYMDAYVLYIGDNLRFPEKELIDNLNRIYEKKYVDMFLKDCSEVDYILNINILDNTKVSNEEILASLLHELGHIILDDEINSIVKFIKKVKYIRDYITIGSMYAEENMAWAAGINLIRNEELKAEILSKKKKYLKTYGHILSFDRAMLLVLIAFAILFGIVKTNAVRGLVPKNIINSFRSAVV